MLRQPSKYARNLLGARCLLDDELLRFVDAGLHLFTGNAMQVFEQ